MHGILVWLSLLSLLLAGCNLQPEQKFWAARASSSDGKLWQIYYDAAWHDIVIDGVRPPSYVAQRILEADNCFLFAGYLDTAGISRTDLPVLRLVAWNVLPPVRRQIVKGEPPDTTGVRWLTQADFPTLVDYQRFSLLAASVYWPWNLRGLELPAPADRQAR